MRLYAGCTPEPQKIPGIYGRIAMEPFTCFRQPPLVLIFFWVKYPANQRDATLGCTGMIPEPQKIPGRMEG
jgi:hypothetical protein